MKAKYNNSSYVREVHASLPRRNLPVIRGGVVEERKSFDWRWISNRQLRIRIFAPFISMCDMF